MQQPVPAIIDVHTHVFPQNVMDKIWRYFDAHHWPIHYRLPEEERTAILEERVLAYTTLCYAHKPDMAAWLNDYVIRFVTHRPKAIAMGTFHPDDADVADYVRAALERGIRGFKVHLEVQRFDPADPRLVPVYRLIAEAGAPILIHTAGAPLEGPWTGPKHFERFLKMAPLLKVIVAHTGGHEPTAYLRMAADYDLYFDTAMSGVDYPHFGPLADEVLSFVQQHPERILFGSDFPNIPYPWEHQVDVVRSWGLGEKGERLVFAENARRLFKIE
jgi:uncharacterized protein